MLRSSYLSQFHCLKMFLINLSFLCFVQYAEFAEVSGLSNYSFPEQFIFGVGTSAYQIEGAWNEGGRGECIWDTYIHKHPEYVKDRSNADVSADFYHKYKDDVQLIKALGIKYFRMSLSWSRILPSGTIDNINKEGIKFYRNVFDSLIKANITPIVSLFHWDFPTKLMDIGGWNNPKIIDYFEDYARLAFRLFGNEVNWWVTMNEPDQHCNSGYGATFYLPRLNASGVADYICNHYMLLAHARAYHIYDKEFRPKQKGKLGVDLDLVWMEPKDATKQADIDAAERYIQSHLGLYAHPIFSEEGDYPKVVRERVDNMSRKQGYSKSRLPYFTTDEVDSIRGSSDFFAFNHYSTYLASEGTEDKNWIIPSVLHDMKIWPEKNPKWPTPGSFWLSVNPSGIRKHINWITKNYGNKYPLFVFENGLSDFGDIDDYSKISYYNSYLNQILLAIREDNANVQGYFAWTLFDDFEWNDGYTVKFGLYQVDFGSKKKTRTPRLSAFNYREIIQTRRINFDFIKSPL